MLVVRVCSICALINICIIVQTFETLVFVYDRVCKNDCLCLAKLSPNLLTPGDTLGSCEVGYLRELCFCDMLNCISLPKLFRHTMYVDRSSLKNYSRISQPQVTHCVLVLLVICVNVICALGLSRRSSKPHVTHRVLVKVDIVNMIAFAWPNCLCLFGLLFVLYKIASLL
jgi:hypothetical protein